MDIATRRLIRREIRRRTPESGPNGLNLYPLMDVMTILLVFMIMQFASQSASFVNVDLPRSSSEARLAEALPVVISPDSIVVDGRPVLTLNHGRIDSSERGGGTGFLVGPLHRVMSEHRDRLRAIEAISASRPFSREVQIIADRGTPYRTLSEVIYTLGQAEFSSLHFVVFRNE